MFLINACSCLAYKTSDNSMDLRSDYGNLNVYCSGVIYMYSTLEKYCSLWLSKAISILAQEVHIDRSHYAQWIKLEEPA